MKSLFIFGGSGFIGKSIIEYICKKKNNLNINKIYVLSRKKIKIKISKKVKIKFITKDIIKLTKIPKTDYIIYGIRSDNLDIALKNFKHFYSLIKNHNNSKILLLSSGAVYGFRKKKTKFRENEKININYINKFNVKRREYAIEKINLEKSFLNLSKKNFSISIARCFTFYGPTILKYNYAISDLSKSIKTKKRLILTNKGNTYRSYMHESDLSRWLLRILNSSGFIPKIYNVGSDKQIIIKNFFTKMSKWHKFELSFKRKKCLNIDDYYVPSTNLALKDLNLKTKRDFMTDIKKNYI